MHGQPLCLSKTLQQLPARDKSNHSQPTPPFPPPTHQHTHQYTFLLSLSVSLPHTQTHVSMHISLSAGSYTDAAISSSLCRQSKVFPANHFVLFSKVSDVKHGWLNMEEMENCGGNHLSFFKSLTESNHVALSRQRHRCFYRAVTDVHLAVHHIQH